MKRRTLLVRGIERFAGERAPDAEVAVALDVVRLDAALADPAQRAQDGFVVRLL